MAARLLALAGLRLLSGGSGMAQNITNSVAPGGSVDLQNNSGNRWYFLSAPSPSGASMARVASDLVSVYTWPDLANFTADPSDSRNRIFQGEYLRVYANSLAVNSVIQIQYATPLPENGPYYYYITVANAPYVSALNITDPSPTVAATVHWAVTFSATIADVTPANFILTNPDGLSGATITGVSGSGANWVVTAATGTGSGLLGCSYVGHVIVSNTIALRNVGPLAVSTVADEDNGSIDPTLGTGISLREAVNYAAVHPGAHTITFAAALTNSGAVVLAIANGVLALAGNTTITGPSEGLLALT